MITRLVVGRPDVLASAPSEWFRYTTLGFMMVITAVLAAVSGTLALLLGTHAQLWISLIVGVLCGGAMLVIQSFLFATASRSTRRRLSLTAGFHLPMSILLGSAITIPLLLGAFQPEVQAELTVVANERSAAFAKTLAGDPRYAAISDLQREIDKKQQVVNDTESVARADPAVIAAQAKVNAAKVAYEVAQKAVTCELDGSCGTGAPGAGAELSARQGVRDIRRSDYEAATKELELALEKARAAAIAAAPSPALARAAQGEVDKYTAELKGLNTERATQQAKFDSRVNSDTGLLSQLKALERFTFNGGAPSAQVFAYLLVVLLVSMPLLSQSAGPPTLYDRLVTAAIEHDERAAKRQAARERQISENHLELEVELEHDLAQRQYEASLAVQKMLVEQQARIAEFAIEQWGAVALERSRQEDADKLLKRFAPLSLPAVPPLRRVHASRLGSPAGSGGESSGRELVEPRPTVAAAPTRARIRMLDQDEPAVGAVSRVDFTFVRNGSSELTSERPATVRVLLDAPFAHVSPLTSLLDLGPDRTSAPVVFEVVPHRTGTVELRFRVYTDVDGQLLQEVSSSIEVGEA